MKSERGQAGLGIVLILAISAIALLLIGMAANQRGMQTGAEAIGESVGEAIDDITAPELAASSWVNSQRNIVPNKHAIERHGADAWATTDCYNRNGTFRIYRVGNREFHLLCEDDDGSIRDLILIRRTNTSTEFEVNNAFTPEPNDWNAIKWWFEGKKAQGINGIKNIVIYVDGLIP